MHLQSTAHTGERVVAGVRQGILGLGDHVTWEARHFGRRWTMAMRISEADPPHMFRDEIVRGPFRRFEHVHVFEEVAAGTRMLDVLDFALGVAPLDVAVLKPYLRRLLVRRNALIKELAEGDG